jgi:hypothetical protein
MRSSFLAGTSYKRTPNQNIFNEPYIKRSGKDDLKREPKKCQRCINTLEYNKHGHSHVIGKEKMT